MLPVIRNHSKKDFDVFIISSTKIEDDITDKVKNECAKWVNIFSLDDVSSARLIADLQLDILVELGGYTAESRLGILCYKPCSIQLSYLGYFAPTYLKRIDGWIGDKILFKALDKIHRDAHKPLRIKGGYMSLPEIDNVKISESKECVVFGCFNHAEKCQMKR